MKKILISMLAIALLMTSCNVGQQLAGAYNMTKCEYSYNSMNNVSLAGINLSNPSLSALNVLKLTSILTGTASSIPLNMTLNVNIKNPNATAAMLNGLSYIVSIDDIQFTTGQINRPINIASGATSVLPIAVGVDLATLMKNNSKDAVMNIGKNIAGISNTKSKITVQIRPTFLVGNVPIASPTYFPVSFLFGGR